MCAQQKRHENKLGKWDFGYTIQAGEHITTNTISIE